MTPARDGQRDADVLHGSWSIDNERLTERLAGSADRETSPALGACRPILGGLGNVDGSRPDWLGHEGFQGASFRLFDPEYRISWADTSSGSLRPPVGGRFADGGGEFFGDDEEGGVPVRARFRWSGISAGASRGEQAFSADDGAG